MAHLEDAIPGLAEFTRWFAEDATRYVVIGGVAREMIYREAGLWEESGTKDFDMVLIAEALDAHSSRNSSSSFGKPTTPTSPRAGMRRCSASAVRRVQLTPIR